MLADISTATAAAAAAAKAADSLRFGARHRPRAETQGNSGVFPAGAVIRPPAIRPPYRRFIRSPQLSRFLSVRLRVPRSSALVVYMAPA